MRHSRIHYYKGINWHLNWGRIAAFNNWDELSAFQNGTNRGLGQFFAFWNLGQILAWNELSLCGICSFEFYQAAS